MEELGNGDQAKVAAHIDFPAEHGHSLREPHVKALTGKLRELRVVIRPGQYRIFFFFFKGGEIILLHGIVKKTQATPRSDLDLAHKRMKDWISRHRGKG